MRTYAIHLDNGNVTGTRAYSAEQAFKQATAIFGQHVDHIKLV